MRARQLTRARDDQMALDAELSQDPQQLDAVNDARCPADADNEPPSAARGGTGIGVRMGVII